MKADFLTGFFVIGFAFSVMGFITWDNATTRSSMDLDSIERLLAAQKPILQRASSESVDSLVPQAAEMATARPQAEPLLQSNAQQQGNQQQGSQQQDSQQQGYERMFGYELMNEAERKLLWDRLAAAKTRQEYEQIRESHREHMQTRAESLGLELSDDGLVRKSVSTASAAKP